jgi:tetratricopeptide (TPR) repeat protein
MKNNKYIYRISKYLFFILFFITIYTSAFPEIYKGEPRTIAHDFLDMEKQFGADARHYEYINSLINKAMVKIAVKKDYTTEEAVLALETIHILLKKEGFVFKQNFLLNTGIDSKGIDCDNYSAIYTAISEVLKLPVIPACAPNHSFLRFNFNDGSYLNWDPVDGKPYPDEYYIKKLNISEKSLRKSVYLKSLTRKEFIGLEYNNIGAYLFTNKKFTEAIPFFDSAIDFYPKYSSAYHNRGSVNYAIKQTDMAFVDLVTANSLDPTQATTYNTLGDIYFDRKEYMKAFDHYAESIKLDPTNYAPYYSLGLILKNAGKDKDADEWFRKSKAIKEKYGK